MADKTPEAKPRTAAIREAITNELVAPAKKTIVNLRGKLNEAREVGVIDGGLAMLGGALGAHAQRKGWGVITATKGTELPGGSLVGGVALLYLSPKAGKWAREVKSLALGALGQAGAEIYKEGADMWYAESAP